MQVTTTKCGVEKVNGEGHSSVISHKYPGAVYRSSVTGNEDWTGNRCGLLPDQNFGKLRKRGVGKGGNINGRSRGGRGSSGGGEGDRSGINIRAQMLMKMGQVQ